jgi:hypothetical protein
MSDKAFFSALDQVMNDMITEAGKYVEEHHVSAQKLIAEASKQGVSLTFSKAMRLIKNQEAAGKLKYDGKRLTMDTKKVTNVWVAVEPAGTSPPQKNAARHETTLRDRAVS